MKIIHLSDTHVGRDNNGQRLQALLDDVVSLGDPTQFLVLHTGDLNDNGGTGDMQQGSALLDGLAAQGWRIFLAPGNHDYGDALHTDPRCAAQFAQHFGRYLFGLQAPLFPVLTLVEDCALIGLDSNAAGLSWWERWAAEGHLGAPQLADLNHLLDRSEVRQRKVLVYLHHHPFLDAFAVRADAAEKAYLSHLLGWNTRRFRRLKDAYSLLQCLRDRANVLLFGHQHFGLDYSTEGQRYGISLALDASSSTCVQMDTDRMRYRIIDTANLTYQTRCVALP
jgi:3',5'-cyclic AMP phosphodiesterase CpdA